MHRLSPFAQSSQSSRSVSRQRMRGSLWLVAGVMTLLGALALAGCGVTATTGLGGETSSSTTPQPSAHDSTQPPIAGGGGGIATSVNPCPGAAGAPAKSPTIVLTVENSHQVTQAHPGDVIEVQLPSKMRWTAPNVGTSAVLTQLQSPAGVDSATQTCHWLYAVKAGGTAKLDFVGIFTCESNAPCPKLAEDEEFTIQVP